MSSTAAARSRNVACPSCGAAVRFRGASSIVAVCPYCKATLVREGVNVEDIGKQAELLEDHSPIRIGTEGTHRGDGFTVVGRIQFKYPEGSWNEWYVLFRGSKGGWLSDASREYSITYLVPPQQVPGLATLEPGQQVQLKGDKTYGGNYVVTNIDQGEVVAGEGELPFRFTAGWKADVVDLRGEGAAFATIDYSQSPPHIYAGEKLPFDTFRFSGLRDPEQAGGFTKGTAKAFKCTGCGAPIEKHLATTEVVACGSCGTVTDVSGETAQIVQKSEKNAAALMPLIPLGTVGAWKNVRYELVGFLRRTITVDGENYAWSEYLLHNVERGYAWITEYNGHYNWVHSCSELPKPARYSAKPAMKYLGRTFKHFQSSTPRVTGLCGEFYWRVKLGDTCVCNDYVDPPLVISSEKSGKELSWSVGEYVEAPALWKAFNLKSRPPRPVGVAPNQPSPHKGKVLPYWLAFFAFLAIGLLTQLGMSGLQGPRHGTTIPFVATSLEGADRITSPAFKLGGFGSPPVTVKINSNASRDWLTATVQLTNADNGKAYTLRRQLGFHNVGGARQGSGMDIAEIPGVPAGRYTLAVEARSPEGARGSVEVYRAPLGWSNFLLFAGFLLLWPVIAMARAASFESSRWSESDYASDGFFNTAESSDDTE